MPRALVTGRSDLLGSAGAALDRAGFDVVTWETNAGCGADGPFDCYVQLPCEPRDLSRGGRAGAGDLVGRADALAAVAGRLGPNASVLLGVDDADRAGTSDPVSLAADLLAAVALALLEDLGRPAARVTVLPVAELCRPSAGVTQAQWEMPTPPLVSAP